MRAFSGWTWAGTVLVGALVVAYVGWTLNGLERELTKRVEEATSLRTEVTTQQEILKILGAPGTQVVVLEGLKPSPAARGRMWWNGQAGGFFVADGLPAAPAGQTYQLWAISGGTPFPAGVFEVDPKGSATLRVKPLPGVGKVERFAVTLEPAGGLAKPSGAMYLAGKSS